MAPESGRIMPTIRVTISGDAFAKMAALNGSLGKACERGVKRILLRGTTNIKRKIGGGGLLAQRSGLLAKAWTIGGSGQAETATTAGASSASGHVQSNLVYAAIHNFGGEVVAKKSQYLAIPLGPAKTPAGVAKFASPRDVPGLTLIKSRSGTLLLVKMLGLTNKGRQKTKTYAGPVGPTKSEFVPWFVLKKSVRVPATHYVDKSIAETEEMASSDVQSAIDETIAGVGLG